MDLGSGQIKIHLGSWLDLGKAYEPLFDRFLVINANGLQNNDSVDGRAILGDITLRLSVQEVPCTASRSRGRHGWSDPSRKGTAARGFKGIIVCFSSCNLADCTIL